MKSFKTYIKEELSKAQLHAIQSEHDPVRDKNGHPTSGAFERTCDATDHFFGKGKDVKTIPLAAGNDELKTKISSELSSRGFKNFDYDSNTAVDAHGRTTSVSKAISRNKELSDSYASRPKAIGGKLEVRVHRGEEVAGQANPLCHDWAGNKGSCKSLSPVEDDPIGVGAREESETAVEERHKAIMLVVHHIDDNGNRREIARQTLLRAKSSDGDVIWTPSDEKYGENVKGFDETVRQTATLLSKKAKKHDDYGRLKTYKIEAEGQYIPTHFKNNSAGLHQTTMFHPSATEKDLKKEVTANFDVRRLTTLKQVIAHPNCTKDVIAHIVDSHAKHGMSMSSETSVALNMHPAYRELYAERVKDEDRI